jgi:uncharacterized repeat protein (TIGR01451 family)
MSREKTRGRSCFAKATLALIGVAGLWLLVSWLTSAPATNASDAIAGLAFQSPIPPVGNPQLGLLKTVDEDTPTANEEIVYTLTYSTTNPGSQAFNVRLYDFLPAGVQFVSANPSASFQDGAVLFTAPSIGATNATATVRVRVREGYEYLHNHALVMADWVLPAHVSLLTSVEQPPTRLRVTKMGYETVLINDELVYILYCENTGDELANDVTVVDVLPTGLPLVEASPPPDGMTLPALSWSLGDLEPGEGRTIVITTTAPASVGVVTNTALADARQGIVTSTVFATQIISEGAILRVTKKGSAPEVDVGDQLVYTLGYKNAGNQPATGVVMADTPPSDVTVTAVFPPPASQTPQLITWDLETLTPGESDKILITTTVGGRGGRTLHNVANITGPGSFPGHAELNTTVRPMLLYLPLMMRNA